jgi:hypothetical protein
MQRPSLKQLAQQVAERHTAPVDVLTSYSAALLLGRLRVCGYCSHFAPITTRPGSGTCDLYGDGLVAFEMPFDCSAFEPKATSPYPSRAAEDRRP